MGDENRYRPAKRAVVVESDDTFLPHIVVYEPEETYTGLLDKDGNELVRVKDRVGFRR